MSLRAFDGKQPCIGRTLLIMKTMEWHVLSLQDLPFVFPSNLTNAIEDVNDWPTLCKGPSQSILDGWSLPVWWCKCEASFKQSFAENNLYFDYLCLIFEKNCKFCGKLKSIFWHPQMKDLDLLPCEWWDLIGVAGSTFGPIAHCILVQMCFTSSCKQNWSSYSFVHNKVQNWLTSSWVEDLVYIYINRKLLWEWPGINPMTWYKKNMLFEDNGDANLNMPLLNNNVQVSNATP